RGFTEKSVDDFIKDFRASLLYAGLLEGNKLKLPTEGDTDREENGEDGEDDGEDGGEMNPDADKRAEHARAGVVLPAPRDKVRNPPPDEWTGPSVRFDLPRGNVIEIRLRTKVTPKEFDKIKKIFDLSEVAFVEDEAESDPDHPPAKSN